MSARPCVLPLLCVASGLHADTMYTSHVRVMSWNCCLQLITLITRLKDSNLLSPETGVQDLVSYRVACNQVERGQNVPSTRHVAVPT